MAMLQEGEPMKKSAPLYKQPIFILLALGLALAPFYEQSIGGFHSHLIEKIGMLFSGNLQRGIDIFDLLMHGTPLTILIASFIRSQLNKTHR